jgi:curved DNA-binding protein CbpA
VTFDPYAELDLPRDATSQQVRSAYRKRAKKAHPDGGGSSDKFNKISRAMLILSDPVRREKYDRTGDMDERTPDNAVAVAISIIVGFVMQVISQHVAATAPDPCTVDLIATMRAHFKKQRTEFENQKVPIVKAAKKMEQVENRFRARKKSNPLLLAALKNQRAGTQEPLRALDQKIQQLDDALLLLDGYDFEFDKPPDQPGAARIQFFTFSGL